MANSIVPTDQKIYLNPYEGNFFDFDNVNSKVYLARKISSTLKVYGDDCIIHGFQIKNYSMNDNIISITIESGVSIIDQTIIDYPTETVINLDVTHLDDSGYLILLISYGFIRTSYTNLSKLKLLHFMDDKCLDFYKANDRLILGKINFDKNEQTMDVVTEGTITLNTFNFEIRNKSLIENELKQFIVNLFQE